MMALKIMKNKLKKNRTYQGKSKTDHKTSYVMNTTQTKTAEHKSHQQLGENIGSWKG